MSKNPLAGLCRPAGLTHRLHLLPAKGRPASRRSIFSRRTSPSIVSSPTLALSRAFSSSRSSAGRALSAASPPRRNASRQAESRAAVENSTENQSPTRGRASPGSRPAKDAGPPPACAGRRTDPAHCDALGPWLRSPYGRPPPKPPLAFVRSSRHPFLHESWINRVSNKTLERGNLRWSPTLSSITRSITRSQGGFEYSSFTLLAPPRISPLGRSELRQDDHHAQTCSL